jgi:RTX calcium-binding nonapeptide repeat (4 copies)
MKRVAIAASLAVVATAAILAAAPGQGSAASGCVPAERAGFGALYVEGDSSPANNCGEFIGVTCSGGSVAVNYAFPATDPPVTDIPDNEAIVGIQPLPCSQLGDVVVLGGEGNDVIDASTVSAANGFPADLATKLDGQDGSDRITGSGFDDRIAQGSDGGSGEIFGGPGNDRLIGDSGADTMLGNGGSDVLIGLEGADSTRGGGGNDTIDSGPGADSNHGDAGNDRFVPGDGNDNDLGGAGRDTIFGGYGRDRLNGGAGADSLFGDAGGDTLLGGTGNDKLRGGPGHDVLHGGPGNNDVRQ